MKVLGIAGKKAGPVEQPRLLKCRGVVTAPACRVEDVDLDQALPTYNAACLLSIAIRCRASVVMVASPVLCVLVIHKALHPFIVTRRFNPKAAPAYSWLPHENGICDDGLAIDCLNSWPDAVDCRQ